MEKNKKEVFLDTNILFPTVLIPKGKVGDFFYHSLLPNFDLTVSQHILDELEIALRRKRHKDYRKAIKNLRKLILPKVKNIPTPKEEILEEKFIADQKDRPVLRSAIKSGASIFLTEDKDFLRERQNINNIEILNIEEFKEKYLN